MKIAATIALLGMAFGISTASASSVSASSASASNPEFSRNLNQCLAKAPGSLVECARKVGANTGSEHVRVVQDISFSATVPPTREAKIVQDCSDDGYEICDIYDCKEDGNMSICNFVGTTCGEYWCD